MEYFCQYCKEWEDSDYCETHFETAHGQKHVTFEKLKARLACLGGLDTREAPPEVKIDKDDDERKPKSEGEGWMWKDKDDPNAPIITNNFRHNVY